jgi:cobalt-zinc-cadmium efflux system membrane fusion protein
MRSIAAPSWRRHAVAAAVVILGGAVGTIVYLTSANARQAVRSALGIDPIVEKAPAEIPSPFRASGATITVPDELVQSADLEWTTLKPADAPRTLTLTGRTGLDLDAVAHVHTQFPGRLVMLGPALGSVVDGPSGSSPGTLLCQIESVDLAQAKSDYLKAKVQVSVDQDTLNRSAVLVQSGVVSDKAKFDAETALEKSRADLEAARQKLLVFGLTESDLVAAEHQVGRERMLYDITSPRSGVISEKNITVGELADTTVNLFTVADMSTLWVWGDVYERDWAKVRVGQPMTVQVSGADVAVQTTIDWISPVIDSASRCIRVRGTINNRTRSLLADMYATLTVTLDPGADALVLPKTAVVRRGASSAGPPEAAVFVRVSSSQGVSVWERRRVAVEAVDAARDRVISGLAAGDVVLTRGVLRLSEEMSQ